VKKKMKQTIEVGDRVADSPVGPGVIDEFSDAGYPRVNGIAVTWLRLETGEVMDATGVYDKLLADSQRPEVVNSPFKPGVRCNINPNKIRWEWWVAKYVDHIWIVEMVSLTGKVRIVTEGASPFAQMVLPEHLLLVGGEK
jgi:hypothetical protein